MSQPPARMPALAVAQAQLELTAEHVGKRLVLHGLDHRLGEALLEAVAACRAARTVGKVTPASALASALPLEGKAAEARPAPLPPSVLKNNALIARRQELDDALRVVLRRLGDQPTLFDGLVLACEGTAAAEAYYKNRHTHRGAIRESMHRLAARNELVIVRNKVRGVTVIATPQRGAA